MLGNENKTKYIVVTDDDLDGAICGLLVKLAFPTSAVEVYYAGNKSDKTVNALLDNKDVEHCKKLFIADVSITKETASRINNIQYGNEKLSEKVIFRDHHLSTIFLNSDEYKWAYVDSEESEDDIYNECGASLLFKDLKDQIKMNHSRPVYESIKKVVKDTKEYDTWAWFNKTKNHHSLFLNVLLQLKGITKFVEEFMSCANRGSVLTEVYRNNAGQVNGVIGIIDKKTNRYISNASNPQYQINFNGYNACLLYCDEFLSEIGNYICRDCKDIDIAILWNYKKICFRTNLPGINLPKIVSKYGGNGRGMSASITLNQEELQKGISGLLHELIFCNKNIKTEEEKPLIIKEEPVTNTKKGSVNVNEEPVSITPASIDVEPVNNLEEDNDISNVIDTVLSKGTDISGVTTIGLSPELDWEYEKAESERRQNEEESLRYEKFLEQKFEEDASEIGPQKLEANQVEEVEEPVIPQQRHDNRPNMNGQKKKKKNFKPVKN